MSLTLTDNAINLELVNGELAGGDAERVVRWALDVFGPRLIMTSSFGAQSAVLLHVATRVVPDIPVVLIDTGYLFPETYQFIADLEARLKLNLKVYQPQMSAARQEALFGRLWEEGGDGLKRYHRLNKVEPMQRALHELNAAAWLAGLRRQQTEFRAGLRAVELQDGIYKVHPLLDWSSKQVHEYMVQHDLPLHPLVEQGYLSIGDTHSTRPVTAEESERAGRFGGLKQECGLHLPATAEEVQSRDSSGL